MKVRDTSQGRMYAVSSEIGCTAINGAMAVDIPAGGQSVILALDKKIVIDGDDDAKFVEVRWGTNTAVGSRPVPPWISDVLAGLISITGDDIFDFNYIPAENKLVVHTDRVDDTQYAEVTGMLERFVPKNIEVEYYNHNIEVSWKDINKYAECTTAKEMYLVDPSKNFFDAKLGYQTVDVCSDGSFIYPNKLKSVASEGSNYAANVFTTAMQTHALFSGSFPEMTTWYGGGVGCTELILDAPKLKTFSEIYSSRLKTIKCNSEEITRVTFLLWGANIENVECVFPKLSNADFATNAKLNKESVLRIIKSLPPFSTGTHVLQLGINIDLQNDDAVWTAIHNVEADGWTLTIRWNPGGPEYTTPEVSTMAMGTLIYAKVDEMERHDGTTERILDWGHYVTNWEERGYEQFRSLESAYEYFGLEMPEVETEE